MHTSRTSPFTVPRPLTLPLVLLVQSLLSPWLPFHCYTHPFVLHAGAARLSSLGVHRILLSFPYLLSIFLFKCYLPGPHSPQSAADRSDDCRLCSRQTRFSASCTTYPRGQSKDEMANPPQSPCFVQLLGGRTTPQPRAAPSKSRGTLSQVLRFCYGRSRLER